MAAILFFTISQIIFESKHFGLTVHYKSLETIVSEKSLETIVSEIETLLKKTQMRVTAMVPKER